VAVSSLGPHAKKHSQLLGTAKPLVNAVDLEESPLLVAIGPNPDLHDVVLLWIVDLPLLAVARTEKENTTGPGLFLT